MQKISLILLLMMLAGCSSYGSKFDCPVPTDGITCQSISHVIEKVQRTDLEKK